MTPFAPKVAVIDLLAPQPPLLFRFPIPQSPIPNPDSRFPIPDSRFPNPESRIPNPESKTPSTF